MHTFKLAQHVVTNSIDLAKANWSASHAERIHNMRFPPKDAWKGVKVLIGGKTSHHINPVVMRVRLLNGSLMSTDKHNVSVITPHLTRLYSNHRLVTWEVVNDIKKRNIIPGIVYQVT